jgi:hypothetical protein
VITRALGAQANAAVVRIMGTLATKPTITHPRRLLDDQASRYLPSWPEMALPVVTGAAEVYSRAALDAATRALAATSTSATKIFAGLPPIRTLPMSALSQRWRDVHSIDLTKCGDYSSVHDFTLLRNAILHANGRIDELDNQDYNRTIESARRLAISYTTTHLVTTESDVGRCAQSCISLIRWIDERAFPELLVP